MLNKFRSLFLSLSLFTVVGLLGLYLYVLMGNGEAIFGDSKGSLEPTNFETLEHPTDQSSYLLCSDTVCAKALSTDGPAPIFNVTATVLRQIVVDYVDGLPTIKTHDFNIRISQFEFLERLPGESFPTVISVRIIPDTSYTSTIAIYSYKPIGDTGAEEPRERVERWVRQITAQTSGK